MEKIDSEELWRQIPPEEKLELMSKAHAKGIFDAVIAIIVASTIAVGLQLGWMMWASLLAAPFIFQFSTGRAWRGSKPRIILQYLAARSAARRYAFTHNAKDLGLNFMCKGHLEEQFDEDHAQEALEAAVQNTKDAEVWIALFNDALIMIEEGRGGANLRFAHLINNKLEVNGLSKGNSGEYSNDREVYLSYSHKREGNKRFKLTSKHAAALLVLEKKVNYLLENKKGKTKKIPLDVEAMGELVQEVLP